MRWVRFEAKVQGKTVGVVQGEPPQSVMGGARMSFDTEKEAIEWLANKLAVVGWRTCQITGPCARVLNVHARLKGRKHGTDHRPNGSGGSGVAS